MRDQTEGRTARAPAERATSASPSERAVIASALLGGAVEDVLGLLDEVLGALLRRRLTECDRLPHGVELGRDLPGRRRRRWRQLAQEIAEVRHEIERQLVGWAQRGGQGVAYR